MMHKRAATAGIKTTLKANGSVSGTEVAVQYKAGDISVFGKYALDDKKASGSLHTSLSSDLDVAMEVRADQKNTMDLGTRTHTHTHTHTHICT